MNQTNPPNNYLLDKYELVLDEWDKWSRKWSYKIVRKGDFNYGEERKPIGNEEN